MMSEYLTYNMVTVVENTILDNCNLIERKCSQEKKCDAMS